MTAETKTCQNCKQPFTIEPEDFLFYDKIRLPPPTWCPECRMQRRMCFRNERVLYPRSCDSCGEKIISMYPSATPFPVYCNACWYSDRWDAGSYAASYDFSAPLFEQFGALLQRVPRVALE